MGLVFNIKRFAVHDGPGIRTTVFLKGCPLKCAWCHNPEGKDTKRRVWYVEQNCMGCGTCIHAAEQNVPRLENGRLCFDETARDDIDPRCIAACPTKALRYDSEEMTAAEVMEKVLSDRIAYEKSGGGLTISGGEPTFAQKDFALELLEAAKKAGIHTAIESCMMMSRSVLDEFLSKTDLLICDIKIFDPRRHMEATGADNAAILDNIRYAAKTGKKMLIRTPLIPGYTDDDENIDKIGGFVSAIGGDVTMELLNFNPLYYQKYDYEGESVNRDIGGKLTAGRVGELRAILTKKGIKTI